MPHFYMALVSVGYFRLIIKSKLLIGIPTVSVELIARDECP